MDEAIVNVDDDMQLFDPEVLKIAHEDFLFVGPYIFILLHYSLFNSKTILMGKHSRTNTQITFENLHKVYISISMGLNLKR